MNQKTALKALKYGDNIYLTGAAGSGKTFVLNKFISYLRKHKSSVAVTASTGIAATHLDGVTIHSWSGIGIKDHLTAKDLKKIAHNSKLTTRIKRADVLVIDEVSMLHAHQLDLVDLVCRYVRENAAPFGGIQVVLCGDFFQLPPVSREGKARLVFESEAWQAMDLRICYLDEQHRHEDGELVELLNAIRANRDIEPARAKLYQKMFEPVEGAIRPTRLYTHNVDVDRENAVELARIRGEILQYRMQSTGSKALVETLMYGCLAPEVLQLKLGAQVMFVRNNFDLGYVNGMVGTVAGFDEETRMPIVLNAKGKLIMAVPETWVIEDGKKIVASIRQVPLRLAWAITVHKSQGMSLDAVEVDLGKTFEYGMGYVALSRVRSWAGLQLASLNDKALEVDPIISEMDAKLQAQSLAFETEVAERAASLKKLLKAAKG